MPILLLLTFAAFFASCQSTTKLDADTSAHAAAMAARDAPAWVAPSERVTSPGQVAEDRYGERLGINITWASDKRITGNPDFMAGSFRHVRYFQMMEKDYGEGNTPATTSLEPCTNLTNPWACPENSMRQHLVRVSALRKMFPQGIIWIAPEVLSGEGWPCKNWTEEQLGESPEEAGYNWGQAAMATYGLVDDVVLSMTNEEWCAGGGRAAAYNEWRRGIIRAHRENPSVQLAVGARHVRPRIWHGDRLNDNVTDVAADVWAYVDSTGGWADYHAHGIEDNRFLPHDRAHQATDFQDFYPWSKWLDENYPNIRKAVGEIAYTTSEPGVAATEAQKLADWPTWASLVKDLTAEAEIVFLYQIEDHEWPEGAFSGSGVYPTLIDSVRTLAREPMLP